MSGLSKTIRNGEAKKLSYVKFIRRCWERKRQFIALHKVEEKSILGKLPRIIENFGNGQLDACHNRFEEHKQECEAHVKVSRMHYPNLITNKISRNDPLKRHEIPKRAQAQNRNYGPNEWK